MPRLLTYNVHRCVGVDRRLDVSRIAAVIAEYEPDIVCLQELDVGRARTGWADQAQIIADHLSMSVRFNAAMRVETEMYGDAILTPLPERLIKAGALPGVSGVPGNEPRGALWVEVDLDGQCVNVINTHLGLIPREQRLQARALVGGDWLGGCEGPTILAGDFNVTPLGQPYRLLNGRLEDVQRKMGQKPSVKTFPSSFPAIRIDHVFVSSEITPTKIQAPFSPLSRMASDHVPLVVDFEISR